MPDRPPIHVCCYTCARDDQARRALGVEPFSHDIVTRAPEYASQVVERHENAGHRVEWAVLRG